jgi:beta-lactamase class A
MGRREVRSLMPRPAFVACLSLILAAGVGGVLIFAAEIGGPSQRTTITSALAAPTATSIIGANDVIGAAARDLLTRPIATPEPESEAVAAPVEVPADDSAVLNALTLGENELVGSNGSILRLPSVTSLTELDAVLDMFLASREGYTGVAVYEPGRGAVFGFNDDVAFPLASVVKLHIMLAYLSAVGEDIEVNGDELLYLEAMISYSDNYAAEVIWQALGGFDSVQWMLNSSGLPEALPGLGGEWGTVGDSPANVSRLLGRLVAGDVLSLRNTGIALGLLDLVESGQRWGITAGLSEEDTHVYMKDGWYPGEEGWRVNSAGVVVPVDGRAPYVLVIFSDGAGTYDHGLETVEWVAALINAFMARRG